MWSCGCCGATADEAWYSASWGAVCAACNDRERRTVVALGADDAADDAAESLTFVRTHPRRARVRRQYRASPHPVAA